MPSEAELEAWYASHYRQTYKGCEQPKMKYVLRAARNAKDRFDWIQSRKLIHTTGSKLKTLDIGASSGEFVSLMAYEQHDAHGIEPHRGYAEYAQSMALKVLNGSLLSTLQNFEKKSFDLITMFHVLEHLVDPVRSLQQIGSYLKDSGVLYIEVPNATRYGSPTYLFFKAHTLYFDHGALRNLLTSAGFEVKSQSSADSPNLRIVARFTGVQQAVRQREHRHELVRAQLKRKWVPYLWSQLLKGEPFVKLSKRYKEKRMAKQYTDPKELMNKTFSS